MANIIAWFDLPVANLERATKFYSAVLAKDLKITAEHGFSLTVLPHENGEVAGCLYQAYDFIPNTSDLLIYLDVTKRIKHAVTEVIALGGKVIEPISKIGPWGYRSIILDSEGNKLALYASDLE